MREQVKGILTHIPQTIAQIAQRIDKDPRTVQSALLDLVISEENIGTTKIGKYKLFWIDPLPQISKALDFARAVKELLEQTRDNIHDQQDPMYGAISQALGQLQDILDLFNELESPK